MRQLTHNKQMQKTNTKRIQDDWVGKEDLNRVRDWKFDQADKWYKHKLKSVQENETHKILSDFEIKTNLASKSDVELINKKRKQNISSSGFYRSSEQQKAKRLRNT